MTFGDAKMAVVQRYQEGAAVIQNCTLCQRDAGTSRIMKSARGHRCQRLPAVLAVAYTLAHGKKRRPCSSGTSSAVGGMGRSLNWMRCSGAIRQAGKIDRKGCREDCAHALFAMPESRVWVSDGVAVCNRAHPEHARNLHKAEMRDSAEDIHPQRGSKLNERNSRLDEIR